MWYAFCYYQFMNMSPGTEITLQAVRLAIPSWNGNVSPVFDTARHLLLVDFDEKGETQRTTAILMANNPATRALHVRQLEIDILICGAVSMPLESMLQAQGVRLFPWVCGPVEDILKDFICQGTISAEFSMPGCCHRCRAIGEADQGGVANETEAEDRAPNVDKRLQSD